MLIFFSLVLFFSIIIGIYLLIELNSIMKNIYEHAKFSLTEENFTSTSEKKSDEKMD